MVIASPQSSANETIERTLRDIPGSKQIEQLIISLIPEFRFISPLPLHGLTIVGTNDLEIAGKQIQIDYKKYGIKRFYEFPMIEINPSQGKIQ